MFQFSHKTTVQANNSNNSGSGIRILEYVDSDKVFCEQSGVVFVTPEVRDKLLNWKRKIAIPMSSLSMAAPRRPLRVR